MKALTLTQPWATLMAIGAKRIETRSWSTRYTGLVAIHAAKGFPGYAKEFCDDRIVSELLTKHGIESWPPLGAIVAVGSLQGCYPTDKCMASEQEQRFGDFSYGRFGWVFVDINPLPHPIPCKGMLGLWEVPDTILGHVMRERAAS